MQRGFGLRTKIEKRTILDREPNFLLLVQGDVDARLAGAAGLVVIDGGANLRHLLLPIVVR